MSVSSEKPKKGLRLMKFGKKKDDVPSKLSILWNGDQMPYSLQSCFSFVYYFNIDAVHIFRKNGNKVAHEVLYSYLIKNKDIAPTFYISSVYDVCSALKAYVKDIPEGLLVKDFRHDWHKLVRYNNETKVREKLAIIIQKLPLANRNMLFHLLFLASKVSEHRLKNEMSTKSVSIILMPTMFERVIDIRKVRDLYSFYDLLEFMIDNAASLMGKDIYVNIESSLTNIGRNLQIIHELGDEPDKLDEDKRVQFVSQDSGLNSSSFIDDKSSQSQSNISRVNNIYDQSILSDQNISSMEDLLNTSDISDKNHRRHIYRSSTIVNHTNVIVESAPITRERSNSNQSTSSLSSIEDIQGDDQCDSHCGQGWNQRTIATGHTCMGLKPHNIKECRPYSICGSPNIAEVIRSSSCQINSSSINLYLPVYDRTFQKFEDNRSPVQITVRPSNKALVPCARNIKKKKPVLKRSSCIIGPLENTQISTENTNLAASSSLNTDYLSPMSDSMLSSSPRIQRPQIIVKQKSRIKKRSFLFRSRLSGPIRTDEVADESSVERTISSQPSDQHNHHQSKPLPLPLATYLRQRSSDEAFV